YALTGGKRDFTSSSQVVTSSFAVLCLPETAHQARRPLRCLDGGNVTPGLSEGGATERRTPDPTARFRRPEPSDERPAPDPAALAQGERPPEQREQPPEQQAQTQDPGTERAGPGEPR